MGIFFFFFLFHEINFFALIWFTILAEARWYSGLFASYKCRWNSSLCQLHMCGVCVCNTISLRCRLVFVTTSLPPILKKMILLSKGITAEPKYISQRNAYGVWMIRANKPRLTFYLRESFELIKHPKNNITKAALSVFFNMLLVWTHRNSTSDVWYFQLLV